MNCFALMKISVNMETDAMQLSTYHASPWTVVTCFGVFALAGEVDERSGDLSFSDVKEAIGIYKHVAHS